MKKLYLLTGLLSLFGLTDSYSQCTTTNATSCVCAQNGQTNCDLLPDMIVGRPPLLVSGSSGVIEYSQSGNGSNNGRLRVSVSTPNIGYGPLEIHADTVYICGTDTFYGTAPSTCPVSGLPPKQLINQWIYHKNGNVMSHLVRKAGSMTYHPAHGHMHVDDWGIYTLRTATPDPNPLNWPVVGTGAKLAFCLMDYGSCSGYAGHCVDSLGNTLLNNNFPNFGLGGGSFNCSPVVQGISSGYTDIYYQYLDGMYITIPPGTCNGNYYIVVQLDPYNYFLESNEVNNVIAVPYTLTQQTGAVPLITASGPTVLCPGGSVMLTASAGNSYLWSNGATTQSITASIAGSYVVTVTNTNCTGTSLPTTVTINALPVTSSAASPSVCEGQSTQVFSSATTAGYTNTPVNFTNNTVISIPDNNVNGVTSSINVSGINPAALITSSVVSVTVNITHTYDADLIVSLIAPSGNAIALSNQRGGSGDNFTNTVFRMNAVTAIGSGTAPFNGAYIPDGNFALLTGNANGTWQLKVADVVGNDIGTINSWTLQLNTQVMNGINYAWTSTPAGFTSSLQNPPVTPAVSTIYTVTATDVVNGCTGTSTVSVTVNPLPLATATANSPVCSGNNLTLGVNGNGSTFSWSGPNSFSSNDASPVISNAAPAHSGIYTVTAVSAAGCTATSSVSATVLDPPSISGAVVTNNTCYGASAGSINLSVTNGAGATFLWSNGATSEDIMGLSAGNYSVTVSNAACVVNGSYQVTQPVILSCTATITKITCKGDLNGAINLTPSGGTPPYTFLWNTGATTEDRTSLGKGNHTVTITDNCGVTFLKTYYVNQLSPTMLLTFNKTNAKCAGTSTGSATVTVSGGIAPFTYSWNTIPVKTTASITGLSHGTYVVTITDVAGCTKSGSIYISQPAYITTVVTQTNVSSPGGNDGSISLAVSGGTGPYTYNWNTVPSQTTASITGLSAGIYKCTVKDVNLCNKKVTVTITQPSPFLNPKVDGSGPYSKFSLTPNPSNGLVQVSFGAAAKSDGRLVVLDILGNRVYSKNLIIEKGSNLIQADLRELPKGVYFVRLERNGISRVTKLIIQ